MQAQTNELAMATVSVLGQLPVLAVWTVGVILSLKNWSAYPKVSALALIGFVTLILQAIGFTVVNTLLPQYLIRNGSSSSDIGFYFSIFGIIKSIFSAISWSLILAAIFTQRYKS